MAGKMAAEDSSRQLSRETSVSSDLSTLEFRKGLRVDLLEAVESIKACGTFAAFGAIPNDVFRDPRLEVQGVGRISLPLDPDTARQVISKARQAPFGKGTQTVVDTSVRNTWELDPSLFTFGNSDDWQSLIQRICHIVGEHLGVKSPIRASLYKMLIYEEGAMFKPHTDSEKIPGMFGTLVLCLPSAHRGGEVVLRHGRQTKVFDSSKAQQSFASWYSDVSHEVRPVTDGYRWVLTYNLTLPLETPLTFHDMATTETRRLRHVLRRWLAHAETAQPASAPQRPTVEQNDALTDHWVYGLEHEYTEASLSLQALKSVDLARVRALYAVSMFLPVDIFLAVLEKTELNAVEESEYYPDRYGWDEEDSEGDSEEEEEEERVEKSKHSSSNVIENIETEYMVKKLVDPTGRPLLSKISITDIQSLQEELFDEDPYEHEESGFTGNEGATETNWYRKAVVFIVRRAETAGFLLASLPQHTGGYGSDILQSLVGYYSNAAMKPSTKDVALVVLGKIAKECFLPSQSLADLLELAIQLHEPKFFGQLITAMAERKSSVSPDFFGRTSVQTQICRGPTFLSEYGESLAHTVLLSSGLRAQLTAIMAVAPVPDSSPAVRTWARGVFTQCWHRAKVAALVGSDGKLIIQCWKDYCNSEDTFLRESILPSVEAKPEQVAFTLIFLNDLYRHMEAGSPDPTAMLEHWKRIAAGLIAKLEVADLSGILPDSSPPAKVPKIDFQHPMFQTWEMTGSLTSVEPTELVEFTGHLLAPQMGHELAQNLFRKLIDGMPLVDIDEFHTLWLPFLRELIPTLERRSMALSNPEPQALFRAALSTYVQGYVKEQPQKETSLVRSPVNCTCSDCAILNAFLQDSNEKVHDFRYGEKRRTHLESNLRWVGVDCKCVTDRTPRRTHALVVTKTFSKNEDARRQWTARRKKADEQLKQFNQSKLKLLLGDAFEGIRRLKGPFVAGAHPSTPPVGTSATSSSNAAVGISGANLMQVVHSPKKLAGTKHRRSGSSR